MPVNETVCISIFTSEKCFLHYNVERKMSSLVFLKISSQKPNATNTKVLSVHYPLFSSPWLVGQRVSVRPCVVSNISR